MKTDAEKNAQKKYQNRVRTSTKAQLNCTINRNDFIIIDDYCKTRGISKAALIVRAVKYCIVHNIDLISEQDGGNVSEDIGAAEDIGD